MRGKTDQQTSLLVLHPQDMIPTHHPIRRIKPIVDAVLRELSPRERRVCSVRGASLLLHSASRGSA
jgi:type II secretory pathway component PulM